MFGLELHPAVVHFPIALGVVGALFAVLYLVFRKEWLRWFAPMLLTIALLGAVGAYFSGQNAEDRAEQLKVPEAAIEEHEESSLYVLGLFGLASLLAWATHAKRRGEWLAALIAVMAAAAVVRTGHLGGKLVYIHGAGRVTPPAAAGATPGAAGESGAANHGDEGHDKDGDRD
ncbi:MAG TPA: DUF2231 domain-containing protein [Candidatus Eisenbacteria bacterium]|nr:DUF2231 domain-containing protein [Candidatus Eisenbacteria bacterium]